MMHLPFSFNRSARSFSGSILPESSSRPWSLKRSRLSALFCCWNLLVLVACDRTPPEPTSPKAVAQPAQSSEDKSSPATNAPSASAQENSPPQGCIIPLPESAPPAVPSVADCPVDPEGRPQMLEGTVSFVDNTQAPQLKVEIATSREEQMHGLMYRSQLSDEQGMIFSYPDEEVRHFWMHNTCLSLDMLFIAKDGTIAGILENVPPWNDNSRSIPCPAAHVLEVTAGWSRRYSVEPGDKIQLSASKAE